MALNLQETLARQKPCKSEFSLNTVLVDQPTIIKSHLPYNILGKKKKDFWAEIIYVIINEFEWIDYSQKLLKREINFIMSNELLAKPIKLLD